MNEHTQANDLLPLYAAGTLDDGERKLVERHLPDCPDCRADLALWEAVGGEVAASNRSLSAPPDLARRALERVKPQHQLSTALRWVYDLMRAESLLIRGEIWPASTAILALGCIAAWISGSPEVIRILTPMIAAASLATIYSTDNDPGIELASATPTSPRQILLARMALVFGFNLILAVLASVLLVPLVSAETFGALILSWLAPMTFLSAAALVLSMWIGTGSAVAAAYAGWLAHVLAGGFTRIPEATPAIQPVLDVYQQFWMNSGLLFLLAILLGLVALWKAGRNDLRLPSWA